MRAEFLPYCRPTVDQGDIYAVVEAMSNGWLTTGPKAAEFEALFAARARVRNAVALNSCTAGLHLAMIASGIGPGDEVIMPALTFVAGAQCALHVGATPVFCDVDPSSLCLSAATVRSLITERTRMIVSMGYAGRPAGIEPIIALADQRRILVVEDAALNAGTLDNGHWAGTRSHAAVYSFYATKNLMTGEGGMLVTNDDELSSRVRTLALHGMTRDAWKRYRQGGSWRYDVVAEGHKYNMPDVAAAIGIAQLERLDRMQSSRDELALWYLRGLQSIRGVRPVTLDGLKARDRHSWAVFPVRIDPAQCSIGRDEIIELLASENIGTSVHYIPTHLFQNFESFRSADVPVTNSVWKELISLPLYPTMTTQDVDDVLFALSRVLKYSHRTAAVS